jgi:hypothetical protein
MQQPDVGSFEQVDKLLNSGVTSENCPWRPVVKADAGGAFIRQPAYCSIGLLDARMTLQVQY